MANLHENVVEACRYSGAAFGKIIYQPYQTPNHILKIWYYLEKIARGDIRRLIITAPPRHGKSKTVSEIFPAWFFGLYPDCEIMLGSFAKGIATRFGRNIRNFMSSADYATIFPRSVIAKDSKAKDEFATIGGGEFHAGGLDGQFTGKGAKLLILDDTIKNRKQAKSSTHKQSLREFYEYVAETRLTPDGAVVVMHTRWASDDLIGWLLDERKEDGWVVVNLPAISDDGMALWPERWTLEYLQKLQRTNPQMFEALYQQKPSIEGGEIVKSSWWQFYKSHEKPKSFQKVLQSWDLTFDRDKEDDSKNDYVVGTTWGVTTVNGRLRAYLLDMIRRKADFNEQLKMFFELSKREPRAFKKYIEKAANGAALISVLQNKVQGIEAVKPLGGKIERLESVTPFIEGGQVFLPDPREEPWVQPFINEFSEFPNGKHDDQVDSTSQALYQIFGEYNETRNYNLMYG